MNNNQSDIKKLEELIRFPFNPLVNFPSDPPEQEPYLYITSALEMQPDYKIVTDIKTF